MQILYTKAYKDGTEHLNAFDRVGIVFCTPRTVSWSYTLEHPLIGFLERLG